MSVTIFLDSARKFLWLPPRDTVSTGTLHDREYYSNYRCIRRHYSDDRFPSLALPGPDYSSSNSRESSGGKRANGRNRWGCVSSRDWPDQDQEPIPDDCALPGGSRLFLASPAVWQRSEKDGQWHFDRSRRQGLHGGIHGSYGSRLPG